MRDTEVILVADNVRSLENVGSFFRTGDAMGVAEILCVGITGYPDAGTQDTRRPYLREKQHKALAKTALSGISLPFRYFENAASCISYMQMKAGFILAVEQHPSSIHVTELPKLPSRVYVVVGNELEGVSTPFLDIADRIVEIPMLGKGISLNVSVSAGIVVHYLRHLH